MTMQTTTTTRRRKTKPATAAGLPTYNLPDGVCSFRHGLTARERDVMDRALSLVGRHLSERPVLDSPRAVMDYLSLHLGGELVEHFSVLFLDCRHRGIAFERMFRGTLMQTAVYPREIVLAALRHHASAVILAHNHPSGGLQPSRADEAITRTLKAALALIDVRLLDHVIVAGDKAVSMAEMRLV